jgi:hypothetical protein
MSWAVGYDNNWQRDIGYGVPSICDHPDCSEEIDRGLGYVCGGEPYGGEHGCGLYFCDKHLVFSLTGLDRFQLCDRCAEYEEPYTPKPDTDEWIHRKATDPSWDEWRRERGAAKYEM